MLPEYLPQLVDVLADIMRPSLRPADFDTEKKVILDEIVRYAVQPQSAANDIARDFYFGGHPLGHRVLGTTESVTALTRDGMKAYFDKRYTAGNIHVAAVGNYGLGRLRRNDRKSLFRLARPERWPGPQRREIAGPGGLKVTTVSFREIGPGIRDR